MQKLIGTIIDIQRPVVNGNTIYVFTLMQSIRKHMEWDDTVYDAVFVGGNREDKPGSRPLGLRPLVPSPSDANLSELTLSLVFLSQGDRVEVTIDCDEEVPTAAKVRSKRSLIVIAVEPAPLNLGMDDD